MLSTIPAADSRRACSAFQRQALAFGSALNDDLSRLRVGVVGCGGTGSAVAMLLARLGVGQVALFDNDVVDRTNLNRLHGARQQDADLMRPKVHVVAEAIAAMGLGVRVVPTEAWIGDPNAGTRCGPAISSSAAPTTMMGGCSWNRLAYYLIPVIDMGSGDRRGRRRPAGAERARRPGHGPRPA